MHRTKASHRELQHLVAKLQHRPTSGTIASAEPLLAVSYPMPPGSVTPRSRPSSAGRLLRGGARGARPASAAPRVPPHRKPSGAGVSGVSVELREVATQLPAGPGGGGYHTSEQLVVASLPVDAAEQQRAEQQLAEQHMRGRVPYGGPPGGGGGGGGGGAPGGGFASGGWAGGGWPGGAPAGGPPPRPSPRRPASARASGRAGGGGASAHIAR